ncbi:hypothetical protein [Deinococcus aquaticus]|uniref:Uncharacterized protein n=1 Tax=Deinococcus aquaticus TaxID=328692 RepID=A0ABY7V749_9DEIO|nr:hypothetical protein [Deinococcus aquaticus]WDA60605.1 hypothetical protein M8445_17865 [Deinococcus aquaticus]
MSLSSFMIFNLSRKLFVLMQHLRTRLTVTLDHPAVVQIATSMAAESNLVVAWRGTDRRISTPDEEPVETAVEMVVPGRPS